jgi:uncharacterized protein
MMSEKKQNHMHFVIGIILLITIGLVIGTSLSAPTIKVYSQGSEDLSIMNVSSTISKDFAPDRSEISFSVETLADLAKDSQTQNAEIADNVINELKKIGILDSQIETINYSVNQEYEWDGILKKNKSIGYKTRNTIKVTLSDLDKTGSVIDTAVNAGVNSVSGIAFTLSTEKQQEAKEIALAEAAEYARVKANKIASGLGIIVGRVHNVSENSYYYTPNYINYSVEYAVASDSKASTPVSPSDVSVSATVTVEFEI